MDSQRDSSLRWTTGCHCKLIAYPIVALLRRRELTRRVRLCASFVAHSQSESTLEGKALPCSYRIDITQLIVSCTCRLQLHHAVLPSPSPSTFPTPLATSRATYDTLRDRYLRAPDGRWAADVSVPAGAVLVDSAKDRPAGTATGHDLGKNNPLSLEEEVSPDPSLAGANRRH